MGVISTLSFPKGSPPRRSPASKYGNRKVIVDSCVFDSKKEALRYKNLVILLRCGKISDLVLQPRFSLADSFVCRGKKYRGISYVGDFLYRDTESGELVVEDTKGFKTDVYKIKKKLFLAKYGDLYRFVES